MVKEIIKKIIPGFIKQIYSKINYKSPNAWSGNYSSWNEAKKKCKGYESTDIVEKVKTSLIKVKNGEYVYERDSILFDKIEYSFPLLSALLWVASKNDNNLSIIDFGGSLGSTYFQNRSFLSHLRTFKWNIVEQKNFVKCGKETCENKELKFYYSIDECIKDNKINIILFSSVIQYLEKPFDFLSEILDKGFEYILFDRTATIESTNHRLAIQKAIQWGKEDSYPIWFFNEQKLLDCFNGKYELIYDFNAYVGGEYYIDKKTRCSDRGYFFRKI